MVDLSSTRAAWADRAPFAPEPFDPDGFEPGPFDRAPFEPRPVERNPFEPSRHEPQVIDSEPVEPAPAGRWPLRFGLRVTVFSLLTLLLLGGGAYVGTRLVSGSDRPAGKSPAAAPETPAAEPATEPAADPAPAAGPVSEAPPAETPPASAAAPPAAGTTKPAPPAGTKPVNPGPAGPRDEVLRLVNVERARAGCPAVTADGRLAAAAGAHSADMAANHYFSHTGRDGSSLASRVDRTGFKWSRLGENIAKGQQTPESVMKAWMKSPGHRANILNCQFKQLGVGLAFDGKAPVWTQDFATAR